MNKTDRCLGHLYIVGHKYAPTKRQTDYVIWFTILLAVIFELVGLNVNVKTLQPTSSKTVWLPHSVTDLFVSLYNGLRIFLHGLRWLAGSFVQTTKQALPALSEGALEALAVIAVIVAIVFVWVFISTTVWYPLKRRAKNAADRMKIDQYK